MTWLAGYNYWVFVALLMLGLHTLMANRNLVKKVIGLGILQTGVFLLFLSSAAVRGGNAPILTEPGPYANPLPQVLILTAIVVSVSTMSVALALTIRIKDEYGSIESDEIREVERG